MSNEQIIELLDEYDNQAEAIKKNVMQICWSMRGGITFAESMLLSSSERTIINDIIKDNLEITKKSGLPYF